MRSFASLLAFGILLSAAHAQTPDSIASADWGDQGLRANGMVPDQTARPTGRQNAAMVAAGTACGLLAMTVVSPTAATGVGIVATVAAVPAGAATCVVNVARRYGYEARFGPSFRDAALGAAGGALVGWGAGAATFFLVSLVAPGSDCGCFPVAFVPAVAVGLTVFAATSAAWAVRGLPRRAVMTPTTLRAPDGTTAPGLAVRLVL